MERNVRIKKHRRDVNSSRRRVLLYCIRFCYSLFIMSKKHYCSIPTIPLSHKNPQHYQRSEFAAAHSRKGGICYGSQLSENLHSTIVKLRPFHYPTKIRNIIKGRNNPSTFPSAVNVTKAYIHLFKRRICGGSQPQGRNSQRRPAAKPV